MVKPVQNHIGKRTRKSATQGLCPKDRDETMRGSAGTERLDGEGSGKSVTEVMAILDIRCLSLE